MKVITLRKLKEMGACPQERRRFRTLFGKQARITPENLTKATKGGLDVAWVVLNSGTLRERYEDKITQLDRQLHSDNAATCPKCRMKRLLYRSILLAQAKAPTPRKAATRG